MIHQDTDRRAVANNFPLPFGYTLNQYRITRFIGQNVKGFVYKVEDETNAYICFEYSNILSGPFGEELSNNEYSFFCERGRSLAGAFKRSHQEHPKNLCLFEMEGVNNFVELITQNNTCYYIFDSGCLLYKNGTLIENPWKYSALDDFHTELQSWSETKLINNFISPVIDSLHFLYSNGFHYFNLDGDGFYIFDDIFYLNIASGYYYSHEEIWRKNQYDFLVRPYWCNDSIKGIYSDIHVIGQILFSVVAKGSDLYFTKATQAGRGRYSEKFLKAIDFANSYNPKDRPQNLSQFYEALI
jgi:hypothetical protein